MRAFLAIEIPESVREALWALAAGLRQAPVRTSWTRMENLHVTLRFLGEIGAADADRLTERLAPPCARTAQFTLAVEGVGAFPNPERPAVLWAGVRDPSGRLAALNALAEEAAEHIGLSPERRPFRGHVTLGRVRDERRAGELTAKLHALGNAPCGSFTVEAVALIESQLRPRGPIYTLVRRFPLMGKEEQWTRRR